MTFALCVAFVCVAFAVVVRWLIALSARLREIEASDGLQRNQIAGLRTQVAMLEQISRRPPAQGLGFPRLYDPGRDARPPGA